MFFCILHYCSNYYIMQWYYKIGCNKGNHAYVLKFSIRHLDKTVFMAWQNIYTWRCYLKIYSCIQYKHTQFDVPARWPKIHDIYKQYFWTSFIKSSRLWARGRESVSWLEGFGFENKYARILSFYIFRLVLFQTSAAKPLQLHPSVAFTRHVRWSGRKIILNTYRKTCI